MNAVMVVAGGNGTRTGLNIPKQFYEVDGMPIIMYGLQTFEKAESVDAVYIVCSSAWTDYMDDLISKYALKKVKKVIPGGNTRQDSMYNGIVAMAEELSADDYVCIFDSNRPLIDEKCIEAGLETARKYGSAVACDDCADTMIHCAEKNIVCGILDRSVIFKGQNPEVTKVSTAVEVVRKGREDCLVEQTLSSLLLHYGKPLAQSPGARKNFKITTAEDLELFSAYLLLGKKEKNAPVACN